MLKSVNIWVLVFCMWCTIIVVHHNIEDDINTGSLYIVQEQQTNDIIQENIQNYLNESNSIYRYSISPPRNITARLQDPGKYNFPWKDDPDCSQFFVGTSVRNSLPFVALASFPGSGNTWLRYLLDTASGVFTGSQYHDNILHSIGLLGEFEDYFSGSTIVQKTHDYDGKAIKRANKTAILLIRNPYKSFMAFQNYRDSGSHLGFGPISTYRDNLWLLSPLYLVEVWEKTALNWINNLNSTRLLVIHFEHLKTDTIPQIMKCLRFLGIMPDTKRIACLKKHLKGSFQRRKQCFPEDLVIFPDHIKSLIDHAIANVNSALLDKGYPHLPFDQYSMYNESKERICRIPCSKYETKINCDERVDLINLSRSPNPPKVETTTQSLEMKALLHRLNILKKNY